MKKLLLGSLAIVVFLSSCGGEDEGGPVQSIGSVYVINEGNFGQSNGGITSYDPALDEVSNFVFQKANNGRPLGDVVQSMFIDENERGYIVVNNSKKIEVVDNQFVATNTIQDNLANPRFLVRGEDQLFISNWGTFDENYALDQSYVLILDATTLEKEGTVNTEYGTENLVFSNGYVYASNSFGNTVSVIETSSGKLEATLEVGDAPGEMVVDSDGAVWLICGGSYQGNNGAIFKLSPSAASKEIDLGFNPSGKLALNAGKGILYYLSGTTVGAYEVASGSLNTALVRIEDAVGLYGIGFNAAEKVLYIADAKGFQGKGTVFRYSPEGNQLSEFEAGIGPNGFIFK